MIEWQQINVIGVIGWLEIWRKISEAHLFPRFKGGMCYVGGVMCYVGRLSVGGFCHTSRYILFEKTVSTYSRGLDEALSSLSNQQAVLALDVGRVLLLNIFFIPAFLFNTQIVNPRLGPPLLTLRSPFMPFMARIIGALEEREKETSTFGTCKRWKIWQQNPCFSTRSAMELVKNPWCRALPNWMS